MLQVIVSFNHEGNILILKEPSGRRIIILKVEVEQIVPVV